MERAAALFGPERLLLNPACGFASSSDRSIASARVAGAKSDAAGTGCKAVTDQRFLLDEGGSNVYSYRGDDRGHRMNRNAARIRSLPALTRLFLRTFERVAHGQGFS